MYISMYVCMYVMHACMHACMHVCMHVCIPGQDLVASPDSDNEEYAYALDVEAAQHESNQRARRWQSHSAPLNITTALVLGLRRIRAEYAQQIATWRDLHTISSTSLSAGLAGTDLPAPAPHLLSPRPVVASQVRLWLEQWGRTRHGSSVLRQLLWAAPPALTVAARLHAEGCPIRNLRPAHVASQAASHAIPTQTKPSLSWGGSLLLWVPALSRWHHPPRRPYTGGPRLIADDGAGINHQPRRRRRQPLSAYRPANQKDGQPLCHTPRPSVIPRGGLLHLPPMRHACCPARFHDAHS